MPSSPKKKKKNNNNKRTKRGNSQIEKIGSPILRKSIQEDFSYADWGGRSGFVESESWISFCNKAFYVFRMMNRSGEAAAIASNQLNFPFPAFIWKPKDKFEIILEPKIDYVGFEWVPGDEGCLSMPGEVYTVCRMDTVNLSGFDRFGIELPVRSFSGFNSRICQHEVDHLYGGLIVDYVDSLSKESCLNSLRKERGFV